MENDRSFLSRRASEEHSAATRSANRKVRAAHKEMAALYEHRIEAAEIL